MLLKIILLFIGLGMLMLHERLISRQLVFLNLKPTARPPVAFIEPYSPSFQRLRGVLWQIALEDLVQDLPHFSQLAERQGAVWVLLVNPIAPNALEQLSRLKGYPLRLAFISIESEINPPKDWQATAAALRNFVAETRHLFPGIQLSLHLPSEGRALPETLASIWENLQADLQIYEVSLFAQKLQVKKDLEEWLREIPQRQAKIRAQLGASPFAIALHNTELSTAIPEAQRYTWAAQIWRLSFLLSTWQIPSLRFCFLEDGSTLYQLLKQMMIGQGYALKSQNNTAKLEGWGFRRDWQHSLILLNLEAQNRQVDVQQFFEQTFFYRQFFVEKPYLWENMQEYPPQDWRGQKRGQLSLPPFSISFLSLSPALLWDFANENTLDLQVNCEETQIIISYRLGQAARPVLEVYNQGISLLLKRQLRRQTAGKYKIKLNTKDLPEGRYYARLHTESEESWQMFEFTNAIL